MPRMGCPLLCAVLLLALVLDVAGRSEPGAALAFGELVLLVHVQIPFLYSTRSALRLRRM